MDLPPWLPTWPSNWPDFEAAYKALAVSSWPRRQFRRGGEAWRDLEAYGMVLSAARKYLEWILRSIIPSNDSQGLLLHFWEEAFNIEPASTISERIARLEAEFRNRGTGTDGLIKAIFLPAFPGADLDDISICRPNYEELTTAGNTHQHAHVRAQFSFHIYSTNEDIGPLLDVADDIIRRCQPAVCQWTVGRYKIVRYGIENAFYGRACAAPA